MSYIIVIIICVTQVFEILIYHRLIFFFDQKPNHLMLLIK